MERRGQDPGQEFRHEAFERSNAYGQIVTRRLISEVIKKPSEKEASEALELITSKVLNPTLEAYTNGDTLKKIKEMASRKYGYPLSAPHLSASVLHTIAFVLNSAATEDFKNSELSSIPIECIYAYDISTGILLVTQSIIDAENIVRGTYDNKLERIIFESPTGVVSLPEQADRFLAEKARALEYAKLLKKDPTGKNLIRHAVEEIENSPNRELAPFLREFVMHGMTFAESAYGIVYPLAEKINQST